MADTKYVFRATSGQSVTVYASDASSAMQKAQQLAGNDKIVSQISGGAGPGISTSPQTPQNTSSLTGQPYSVTLPNGQSTTIYASSPQEAMQKAQASSSPNGVDTNYQLHPGETTDQYNARIASYNSSKGTPAGTSTGTDSALLALGLTQDQINQMNPTQKALLGTINDAAKSIYGTSGGITLSDAINYAKNDPVILAKYSDELKIDQQGLSDNLGMLQQSVALSSADYQRQFENDRKALAEQSAAAGQAYSGFRGKAQSDLSASQSSIVESSRAQTQKSLQDAQRAFEAKYGTSASTPSSLQFMNPMLSSGIDITGRNITPSPGSTDTLYGSNIGGITGTQPTTKQNDILSKATEVYNLGQLPTMSL